MNSDYIACAYTQKIVKFVKMMAQRGHEVITYGGASPCAYATEHVHVVDVPPLEPNRLFDPAWDGPEFVNYNTKVIPEIVARASGQDFLCITMGIAHKPVADALPDLMAVETGIGYSGTFAKFRVFESYAWMHAVMGWKDNGRFYDAVIPNFFDVADFPNPPMKNPGRNLLWMGRFVERKGPHVAVEIAEATDRQLVMAGQGILDRQGNKLIGGELSIESDNMEHVGPVGALERNLLMQNAHALIMPTLYIEPFGGVAVEALMAGTPVISTDWGAFPEFIVNFHNGYRFHTLKEAVKAVGWVSQLDRSRIQHEARCRFSLQAVGRQYEDYFERLSGLWGDGWYAL